MKIMVIGASGYLENAIFTKLKECKKDKFLKLNVMKYYDICQLLSYKPDVIIWSIYDVEKEMSFSQIGLNEIIKNISSTIRLIYVSTTVGKGLDQTENIIPHYRTSDEYLPNYINGKIEGEGIVRKQINHVVVRPGSIYGYDFCGKMDKRMDNLLQISKTKETYSRTANMYLSFVHVEDLACAIVELVYSDFKGVINIAGEKHVSYFDFNRHLANLLNIDNSFIVPDYKTEEIYNNLSAKKRKTLLNALIRDI
jgi:dTDP-4-dehydrorhamnose reductase